MGLAIGSGSAVKFLGELGIDVVDTDPAADGFAPDFAAVVPADFLNTLANAILDPAFLLQALPGLLRDIAEQLRDLADGIPEAVGDALRSAGRRTRGHRRRGRRGPRSDRWRPHDHRGHQDGRHERPVDPVGRLPPADLGALDRRAPDVRWRGATTATRRRTVRATIDDIAVTLTLEDTIEATAPINLGLDGLPLSVQGGVTAGAEWSLSAGIGLSRDDGPYLRAPEASLDRLRALRPELRRRVRRRPAAVERQLRRLGRRRPEHAGGGRGAVPQAPPRLPRRRGHRRQAGGRSYEDRGLGGAQTDRSAATAGSRSTS